MRGLRLLAAAVVAAVACTSVPAAAFYVPDTPASGMRLTVGNKAAVMQMGREQPAKGAAPSVAVLARELARSIRAGWRGAAVTLTHVAAGSGGRGAATKACTTSAEADISAVALEKAAKLTTLVVSFTAMISAIAGVRLKELLAVLAAHLTMLQVRALVARVRTQTAVEQTKKVLAQFALAVKCTAPDALKHAKEFFVDTQSAARKDAMPSRAVAMALSGANQSLGRVGKDDAAVAHSVLADALAARKRAAAAFAREQELIRMAACQHTLARRELEVSQSAYTCDIRTINAHTQAHTYTHKFALTFASHMLQTLRNLPTQVARVMQQVQSWQDAEEQAAEKRAAQEKGQAKKAMEEKRRREEELAVIKQVCCLYGSVRVPIWAAQAFGGERWCALMHACTCVCAGDAGCDCRESCEDIARVASTASRQRKQRSHRGCACCCTD